MKKDEHAELKRQLVELELLRLVYPELAFEPVRREGLSEAAVKVLQEYDQVSVRLINYEMENQHNGKIPQNQFYLTEYAWLEEMFDRARDHLRKERCQDETKVDA